MRTLSKFIPLLILYVSIILIFANDRLEGDEVRYVQYAKNILQGFYTSSDNPYLRNGPGYPMFLVPFYALKLPHILSTLGNAICLIFAVIFFYRSLKKYVSEKLAYWGSYALGLYPIFFRWIPQLSPESLSALLICAFIYFFLTEDFQSIYTCFIPGICLGLLILTKYIFGIVIIVAIVSSIPFLLISRAQVIRKALGSFIIGLLICTPYLAYTYYLSGNYFYWGTNGGEQLYWMSSPYKGEMGNWQPRDKVTNEKNLAIHEEHKVFYKKVDSLSHISQNTEFRKRALRNFTSHPEAYLKHYVANVSRIFFSYPLSFRNQSLLAYSYIIPNIFLIVFLIFSIVVYCRRRKPLPLELVVIWLLFCIYLGGSSLLSAKTRYLLPAIPAIILWLTFIFSHYVSIKISIDESKDITLL